MKMNLKRFLSMVLAMVLVLSCMPAMALADTTTPPALPTATVTEIENDELTFAMNFLADEVEPEQLTYYGDWYADFELTINKDMTVNAEGGADGYLSGQYDEAGSGWINVPFDDVELEAGKPLKIMEYAAELLGQPGLKYTYGAVYREVKDFNCGMFLEPEFMAANPDLEITLELKMYNPADETESYVIGKTYTFTLDAPELPTATVTEIENDALTFAMNFKADEVDDKQLGYYGDWYADFELTINKDMTVNANGGADGYLSGQYDEAGSSWINVPFENVTLKANEPLKIMEYAAELMGQPGLKYTYREVYRDVKDFDCGMFLEDAFMAANPDLEIKLELKMYNPDDETENYVIGETYIFTLDAPELPTATVTEIENDALTFAMNFLADEVDDKQLGYYGDWYADFELTVNKDMTVNANGGADGYLSGQYDKAGSNWINVPFENVTLKANEPLKIMEYAAELLGEPGLKYTYREVYRDVKDFDCGMFLEDAFMAANPDLEIKLELKMYNPDDETENYVIGETYIFTLGEFDHVAYNTVTKKLYSDLTEGLLEAKAGETVQLLKDVDRVPMVIVTENVVLDLNGFKLTADYVPSFGDIADNSENNTGLLVVAPSHIQLKGNEQFPIWDATANGYRFAEILGYNTRYLADSSKFAFQPLFEAAAHEWLLQGADVSGVSIEARVYWSQEQGERSQSFVYNDEQVAMVVNSYQQTTGKYSQMYTLTLKGAENYDNLTFKAVVSCSLGDNSIDFESAVVNK